MKFARAWFPIEKFDEPSTTILALAAGVADPERPVTLEELMVGLSRAAGLKLGEQAAADS